MKREETPFAKVQNVGKLTFIFIIAATLIYYIIGQGEWSLFNCFYMTVISITTVGYGEIMDFSQNQWGRAFSIVVVIWGYILLVYFVSVLSELLVTGEIKKYFKMRKVKKMVDKYENHYILCGFGEMGKNVAKEIVASYRQIVIIDSKPDIDEIVHKTFDKPVPTIYGNASDEEVLLAAGIKKASGLVLALPEDKDNLFILVTAKSINPAIFIATKVVHEHNSSKFKNAGAAKTISPSKIGGLRLASEVLRPTVTNFLDVMLRDKEKNLRIDEIELVEGMECINRTLQESEFRNKTNVLIMAVAFSNDDFIYNPPADHKLEVGQKLIVLGESKDIAKFKNLI